MREKILLGGDTNTSKTMSLVSLAILYPNSKVVILDPDDGVVKVLHELGVELPNLTVIPVTPNWEKMMDSYHQIKPMLGVNDWLCLDMMARFWDFAQNYYSKTVFGESPSQHLLTLRNQAKKTNFGGFDGLTDWTIIKRMHNEELVDDATLWSPFNVMATTSLASFLPVEKLPKTGVESIIANEFGVKFEGEKHNIYRFDTIAVMTRKVEGSINKFSFRLAKDKGRPLDIRKEFDMTGKSFYEVYKEYRRIQA